MDEGDKQVAEGAVAGDGSAEEQLQITIAPDLPDNEERGGLQMVHTYQIKLQPTTLNCVRETSQSFGTLSNYSISASTRSNHEHQCSYCQKTFTSRHYYRKHLASGVCVRDLHNPRLFCVKCGKKFRDPGDLVRHDNFHRVKERVLATPHVHLS